MEFLRINAEYWFFWNAPGLHMAENRDIISIVDACRAYWATTSIISLHSLPTCEQDLSIFFRVLLPRRLPDRWRNVVPFSGNRNKNSVQCYFCTLSFITIQHVFCQKRELNTPTSEQSTKHPSQQNACCIISQCALSALQSIHCRRLGHSRLAPKCRVAYQERTESAPTAHIRNQPLKNSSM